MSSLKRTQMLQPRNLISSIFGGLQSAALDDEASPTRFSVLAARYLTNSECSASSAFSSDKSSGTSESWAVVARLQISVIRSATGRISTTTERSKRKGHKAIGSIL